MLNNRYFYMRMLEFAAGLGGGLLAFAVAFGLMQGKLNAQDARIVEHSTTLNKHAEQIGAHDVLLATIMQTVFDMEDTLDDLANKPRHSHAR